MKEIYYHPEEYTKEDLENKFGKERFLLFSQLCLGGKEPYASTLHNGTIKLTQEGVREYHRIKMEIYQLIFTFLVTLFIGIQVILLLIQYIN